MKEIIDILKTCVKDNNISPQLANIQFILNKDVPDSITVYNDGNMITTHNKTEIEGYINGKSFIKNMSIFSNPKIVNTQDQLIIKEGKRKCSISKYELSGGEEEIKIPYSDNEHNVILNENIVNAIKICLFSAKNSNLNNSGDGIMIDFSDKFKKIYSTNGETLSVVNIMMKNVNFKIFIPYFLAESICKHYIKEKENKLSYDDKNTYVKFDNTEFKFISLVNMTSENQDLQKFLNDVKPSHKNILIDKNLLESINNICSITDESVKLKFVKDRIDICGNSVNTTIEDSVNANIKEQIDINLKLKKDNLKYGINNFEKMDICPFGDKYYILKFKSSNSSFYCAPVTGGN